MKFKTETGSLYEVDLIDRKIRRLEGPPSSSRHFQSGDWHEFDQISDVVPEYQVIVGWNNLSYTYTSRVVEIL